MVLRAVLALLFIDHSCFQSIIKVKDLSYCGVLALFMILGFYIALLFNRPLSW